MKITHICHSCFLVELSHTLLLFDYFQGPLPVLDSEKALFVFPPTGITTTTPPLCGS